LHLLHGWDRSDILALLGVILAALAIFISLVPPLRHLVQGWWRGIMLRAGLPRSKYAKWFIRKWGMYENPYLDDVESLDLRNTYVPLSFRTERLPDKLTIATDVLNDPEVGNLIIDGGPGSGKSTLLKAYGVALLQNHRLLSRGLRPVPFLVQLRKLALFIADGKGGVRDYLLSEVLVAGAGMSAEQARHFLQYAIRHRQVAVMLDGLDEVTTDRYQPVLEAIFAFMDDHNPACPTNRARLLLTCRRQNFLAVRDDWVPAFGGRECSLAPLRNSEVFSYLDKLRRSFRPPNSPESFIAAVRSSGTLELHRTPLILAMSVGLYARKQFFEVPSSIARLYESMVREMLDRHSFRRDHGGNALRFQADDKFRFLREFSLHAAQQSGQFDDFTKEELTEFATQLAPRLNAVREPADMVEEIIDRAGLLSDVGEKGLYVFAHRSIQEYLAAEELRIRPDGAAVLLGKAADPEWRQVVQFYCAGQEERQIDAFLRQLSKRNSLLAAYCLAGAKPSDHVAEAILDAIEPVSDTSLPALAAATISPRVPIQEMAIARLRAALTTSGSTLSVAPADVDGLLPLLSSLAGTNAAEIAALVPQVVAAAPDDPRLVDPLWRCLATPAIETRRACATIVQRMLSLVMDPDALEELARQDRYDREFLTADIRRRGYPFADGLDPGHNQVTLLAWAEHLNVMPAQPNRFFEAKAAGQLHRVEAARKRTVSFSLFWPTRLFIWGQLLGGLAGTAVILATDPGSLLRPFHWWTLLLLGGLSAAWFGLFIALAFLNSRLPDGSRVEHLFDMCDGPESANLAVASEHDWISVPLAMAVIPAGVVISATPLISSSLPGYIAVTLVLGTIFWASALNICSRPEHFYLYKPNEYVDVYDDPRSRHWLGVKAAAPTAQAGQRTP